MLVWKLPVPAACPPGPGQLTQPGFAHAPADGCPCGILMILPRHPQEGVWAQELCTGFVGCGGLIASGVVTQVATSP